MATIAGSTAAGRAQGASYEVKTVSLNEGDHRLSFTIDELDTLGQIDGLKDPMARLRKFGGRCIIGFQSIRF
jgi:type IV secretory pathway TraG/TraD family ATPase VirD4